MNVKTAVALGLLVLPTTAPAADTAPRTATEIVKAHDRAVVDDLDDYLRKNPRAEDRDEAYAAIFDRAIDHDWFAEADPIARRYLGEEPDGPVRTVARIVTVMSHVRAARFAEALAAYQELMKVFNRPEQAETAVNFSDTLAGAATTAGEFDVARKVYEIVLDKYPDHPELRKKVEDDLARLDRVGKPSPAVVATDIHGQAVRLNSLKGKYVLIDFWATWCAPCLADLPNVQSAYAKYHDRGFDVIAVSLDDGPEAVADFARAHKLPWHQVHNATAGSDLVEAFNVGTIPASYLVDPDGKVVRLDLRGPALDQALARLLKVDR